MFTKLITVSDKGKKPTTLQIVTFLSLDEFVEMMKNENKKSNDIVEKIRERQDKLVSEKVESNGFFEVVEENETIEISTLWNTEKEMELNENELRLISLKEDEETETKEYVIQE